MKVFTKATQIDLLNIFIIDKQQLVTQSNLTAELKRLNEG